ncbi:MAG: hypothetical protein LBQ83_05695 [Candidatus Margulisbacteria bacterium]|jgi:hypothetical protein|nr:hypothetical protein [Candidatus Margulisiibacteriota bacterium]
MRQKIALLTRDDIRGLEIINNKLTCAEQLTRPGAVPGGLSAAEVTRFFKEALFSYADAQYLQENYWRELAAQHGVAQSDRYRLYIDFGRSELYLAG